MSLANSNTQFPLSTKEEEMVIVDNQQIFYLKLILVLKEEWNISDHSCSGGMIEMVFVL